MEGSLYRKPRYNEFEGRDFCGMSWSVYFYVQELFSGILLCLSQAFQSEACGTEIITVEPRFNEPLFNEVLDITNDIQRPGQNYSQMYEIEPRYNEPRYNEFFDITNIKRKPKRKIYLDIMNYNVSTRQKINAEQINSRQILQPLW